MSLECGYAMDRRLRWIICGLAATLAGCGSRPELAFPDWLHNAGTKPANEGRFLGYSSAAQQVESAAQKYLSTVYFTPDKRDACLKLIGPALKTLSQSATRAELGWGFKPYSPFEAPEHVAAWRLLGRGLVWKIEAAVHVSDHDAAVRCTVLATRFGLDLLGGGAMEGSLGLAICDEARRALSPALTQLSPEHLAKLSQGLADGLAKHPKLANTIEHERLNLLAGVQLIQDTYQREAWGELIRGFGPDVRAATDRLKEMKANEPTMAIAYFKGLADETDQEARYYSKLAELPRAQRGEVAKPDHDPGRTWRRFARHCTGSLRPLLDQFDDTLARTRLMVVEAELQRLTRLGQPYPRDLSAFSGDLAKDPYSGRTFPYRADGTDYRVYSVGPDLSDDGGQTDESFSSPDIRLESR